jgi:two-component system, OmpR family, sensor histidine kinase MprB
VGLAVALVALGAFVTVKMSLESSLDNSLLERAHHVAKSGQLPTMNDNPASLPEWATGAGDTQILLTNSFGRSIPLEPGFQLNLGDPERAVAAGHAEHSIRTIAAGDIDYRVVSVHVGPGTALVVAQNMAPQERVLRKLGAVMFLFGVAGVIGAAAAGWAVARNGLRPVRRLTTNVERIARTEDLRPLPVEGDDEIARLATAFNRMLVALSASRDRQRRLVADAGHELRTPLTSLRTNLELLLQADESGGLDAAARAELLDDVRAQIEEMSNLVGDLVELARDEPLTPVVEQVDLAEIVESAVSRVRRRGPTLNFVVDTEPWWVTGEAGSLERAVINLLDNAVRGSPPPTATRSSTGSTGPRSRGRCPVPASACPSSARSPSGTPARCGSTSRTAAAPGWSCSSPGLRWWPRELSEDRAVRQSRSARPQRTAKRALRARRSDFEPVAHPGLRDQVPG